MTALSTRGSRSNGLLRAGLVGLLVVACGLDLVRLARVYPPLVDLEIPLRAAERWLAGGSPYLASSFAEPAGYGLPFLYAPPTLPFFAALSLLPREVAGLLWVAACLAAAAWGTRRLGIPWVALPLLLAWPPFAEALLGGNIQVFLFAALVAVFWDRASRPWQPRERDVAFAPDPGRTGTLAAFIPAMKISIPHAWVGVAGRRPMTAFVGALVAGGVALATLPLVGLSAWQEWIQQLGRALDPTWVNGGYRLVPGLPSVVSGAIWLAAVLACLVVPGSRRGTWAGLLSVLGAATLHVFSLLFVLPAILVVRREIGLAVATLVAIGGLLGSQAPWLLWLGALVAAACVALGERWPALVEATGRDAEGAQAPA